MYSSKTIVSVVLLTLAAMSGISRPSHASTDVSADHPLSVQDCISYSLEHHGSVLSAKQDLAAGWANVKQAQSGYMPKITLNSDYNNNGFQASQPGILSNTSNNSNGTESYAQLSEAVYDGGKTMTAIRQSNAGAKVLNATLDMARQERVLAVTQAFYNSLLTKRLADIAAQSVTQSEEQRKLIQARIDAGDAAKVDVYPVDVQLANSKLSKIQADNSARIAANALRNAMGLGKGPALQLVDAQQPPTEVPLLDQCLRDAMIGRPEIARSSAQIESAQAGLTMAKLQTIPVPTVSLNYGVGLGGTNYNNQWTIGVGLSMNIFDGGAAKADVDGSKARLDSSQLTADQTNKDVSTEVEQAYMNLASALEQLNASQSNVTLAQTNLEVAQEKYSQGLAIPLEIVTAQVSYANAQATNAQSLYNTYIARAELDKAMGKRGY